MEPAGEGSVVLAVQPCCIETGARRSGGDVRRRLQYALAERWGSPRGLAHTASHSERVLLVWCS